MIYIEYILKVYIKYMLNVLKQGHMLIFPFIFNEKKKNLQLVYGFKQSKWSCNILSLIGGMTCFDHGNEFSTVSVLTYMITY